MTRFELYVNLRSANSRASELDRTASRIKKAAENLQSELNGISANWQGAACSAYIDKGRTLIGKMNQEAKSLNRAAETIRRIAQRTYEAEIKALEAASQRNYHT